jgi:AcrR family transcriptional regulator
MSPRPRKASDEDVFAATLQVMQRLGPTQLTLAHIAARAGLTAGALVQRFGSKRALLLALSARFADSTAAMFDQLRAAAPSPITSRGCNRTSSILTSAATRSSRRAPAAPSCNGWSATRSPKGH